MPSSSSNKRTQAVPAKQRNSKGSKTPRGSPPKDKDNNHPSSLNAPVTTASSASKRVAKAVRSAGAGGGKSSGGGGHKGRTNNKAREGPEAERSDEEDVLVYPDGGASDDSEDDDDVDDVNGEDDNIDGNGGNIGDNVEGETTPEPEEKRVSASTIPNGNGNGKQKRVVLGVEGKSVPKSEIGMDALLAGAKPRPESHNITRGYEFISSPASRLIIPVEKAIGLNLNKRGRMRRHDSIASTDSEWEKVQFEMDASVDAFSDSESLSLSQRDISRKKKAYADVVKRNYTLPPVAAAS